MIVGFRDETRIQGILDAKKKKLHPLKCNLHSELGLELWSPGQKAIAAQEVTTADLLAASKEVAAASERHS
jgi:hypothetical protein